MRWLDGCGSTSASRRSATACGAAVSMQALLARAAGAGDQPLGLDLLGDLAQRDLAQGGEVLDLEEAVERGRDARGRVDLAGLHAGDQRLRREVDDDDLVGLPEDVVGQRLADRHAGQLGDAVVERLEVLDVDRREDVDAGAQHVVDVLVALAMLDARGVGVRELVDERQLGAALEERGQIHLGQLVVAVGDAAARDELERLGLRGGLRAVVRLEVADDDVAAGVGLGLPLLQHAVRLADPGGHAEEDLVVTAALHRPCRQCQAPSRLWTTRSTSLMPMNGAISPPSP